ncbi:MAG: WD40/YVTN/BNR-like repeat-containing protein [Saprospiraceae bacterium]
MHRYLLLFSFIFLTISLSAQVHDWQRTNPGGGGAFNNIEAGPPAPNGAAQIIAGSDLSGAYYSWDGGQTWGVYGAERGLLATHVSGIGFHPTSPDIFFLAVDGGVYKSASGGGFFYEVLDNGYVTDVEVSAVNPQIVYAAHQSDYFSSDGIVYKSTNGGESFTTVSTNLPSNIHILEIVAHPTDANIVYVLTGDGREAKSTAAAYRSLNGGVTWTQLTPSSDEVMHLAFAGSTLYLTTMQVILDEENICIAGNKGQLFKSTDNGTSWGSSAVANYTGVIFTDPNQPQRIRLIDPRCPYFWFNDSGTWESTDGGQNFTRTGDPTDWTTGYQAASAPQWSYGTNYNGISKTVGGSKTDADAIFWSTIQWSFGSFDGGETFNHLHTQTGGNGWQSTGFDNVVMTAVAANASNPNEIYIGFADIGLWRSTDGGQSWEASNPEIYTGSWGGFGGNCHNVVTDPTVAGKVWSTLRGDPGQPVFLLKSTQSGAIDSWSNVTSGIPNNTEELLGLSISPTSPVNNRTLYVTADGDVYRSTNDGNSWTRVLQNGQLHYTAVDNQNGQIVYAGGMDGLYRSTNGGSSWTQIKSPPNIAGVYTEEWVYSEYYVGISSIVPDPNVSGQVHYTYYGGNTSSGGLFRWANGQETRVYEQPYLRCVTINPSNSQQMYLGSSFAYYRGFYNENSEGVLYSSNGGQSWSDVNGDLPYKHAVRMAIIESNPQQILVGNSGSGFQIAPLGGEGVLNVEQAEALSAKIFTDYIKLKWRKSNDVAIDLQRAGTTFQWKTIAADLTKNTFIDQQPQVGDNYYRLRYKSSTGDSFSKVIQVNFPSTTAFSIEPNPLSSTSVLRLKNNVSLPLQLEVIGMDGKLQQRVVITQLVTPLADLITNKGIYSLRLVDESGAVVGVKKVMNK